MYRHLLAQFHPSSPSSSAPEGPILARPSRSVEKLCVRRDSFGWPDAVVQLLFGSRY